MQRGTYVAFLFRADGSAVGLCVTQGTTEPLSQGQRGRALLDDVVTDVRKRSGVALRAAGFDIDNGLDLHATTRLGRDYQRGTIAFKLYESGAVPSDEALLADLEVALAAVDDYIAATSPTVVAQGHVAAIYIGQQTQDSLDEALSRGSWGWRRPPAGLADLPAGALLVFASGYTGGRPIVQRTTWQRNRLARAVIARTTSSLLQAGDPAAEAGVNPPTPYRYGVRIEALEDLRDVPLDSDGPLPAEVVEALRLSVIQSRPVVVTADTASALAAVVGWDSKRQPPALTEISAAFRAAVDQSGLHVPIGDGDRVQALIAALVTKPFVILTGLSGSGKTQLALRLGEWFGNRLTVAVRPDWTGPEALFGYEDGLRGPDAKGRAAWFVPQTLAFLLRARRNPRAPYLLLLDEMNLAHVERYFSDFLSGLESGEGVVPDLERGGDGEWRLRDGANGLLPIPRNVFVIGTVNVDETTYLFSPKVLDRATTFELRTQTSELQGVSGKPTAAVAGVGSMTRGLLTIATDDDWHLDNSPRSLARIEQRLVNLHRALSETGDEFGHRAFREGLRMATALVRAGRADEYRALDHVVLLKIVPRIHGSRQRVEPVLRRLLAYAQNPDGTLRGATTAFDPSRAALRLTADKVGRMLAAVQVNQFVSFTE
jgi:hypothetical protein